MKTRHMTNMDQKIDKLKSYIEEQFCSRDKKLEELCGNLFEKFRKQIELQFTNELTNQSKRIEELESDKIMLQHQILEIKKQTCRINKKSKSWNNKNIQSNAPYR